MTTVSTAKPVILCIGTTNVSGDSLGPAVGDRLIDEYNIDAYVYGRTGKTVNGINYDSYVNHIKTHHSSSLIIAVDACLGINKDIGRIKYIMRGLQAGAALNKKLGKIGDIGILGVVGVSGKNNLKELMAVPKENITSLSEKIANKIYKMVKELSAF